MQGIHTHIHTYIHTYIRSIAVSVYNWHIQFIRYCIILMLILFNCEIVVEVFGKIFFILPYTNRQFSIVVICWSVYIFDSLYRLLASARGPLKFRILIALFCSFSIFSTVWFLFCPQIWHHIWDVDQK